MFDIGSTELLLIVIVAILVIGPKDLPRALYKVGQVVSKARGMARHFRTGVDAMVREVEMQELEKKWAAQNQRILEEHPATELSDTPMEPLADKVSDEPASAFPGFPPPPPPEPSETDASPEPASPAIAHDVPKSGTPA